MTELMLLASEKIENQRYYLYAIELQYQKIVKILKVSNPNELGTFWKIGFITEARDFSRYNLDDTIFVTSKENLKGVYPNFLRLMLNKASYPDRIISLISGTSYAIVRIRQPQILEHGNKIEFVIWGTDKKCIANVSDPWWVHYWEKGFTIENRERYEKFLSMNKRKVFGLIESKDSILTIKKIIVL